MSLKLRNQTKTRRGYREMSARRIIGKVKRQTKQNHIRGRDELIVLPVFEKGAFVGLANLEKSVVSTIEITRKSIHGIGIDSITISVLPKGSFRCKECGWVTRPHNCKPASESRE